MDLGKGWNYFVRRGRVSSPPSLDPNPKPKPTPQQVTEEPKHVTANSTKGRPRSTSQNPQKQLSRLLGNPRRISAASVKTSAARPKTPKLMVSRQIFNTPFRIFLISIASTRGADSSNPHVYHLRAPSPRGAASARNVVKSVFLSNGSTPLEEKKSKVLRPASWNGDRAR